VEKIVFHLAGLLIGVTKAGFGGGTGILVPPLLALVVPAREAVGMMLPLLLTCDLLSLYGYWKQWESKMIASLIPGCLLGIMLGTHILRFLPDEKLKQVIGALACFFAGLEMIRPYLRMQGSLFHRGPTGLLGTLVGFLTGVASSIAHVGGVITSLYLLPQGLSNRAFVGTSTALFFLLNSAKVPPYVSMGLINPSLLYRDLFIAPSVALGTLIGFWLNRITPGKTFRAVILASVFLTSVKLLVS
jgi:uncharacterized membrane protein YfcA